MLINSFFVFSEANKWTGFSMLIIFKKLCSSERTRRVWFDLFQKLKQVLWCSHCGNSRNFPLSNSWLIKSSENFVAFFLLFASLINTGNWLMNKVDHYFECRKNSGEFFYPHSVWFMILSQILFFCLA